MCDNMQMSPHARCIKQATPLISERTGLIKGVHQLLVEPDDAKLFYCFTRVAYTSRYSQNNGNCYQQNGGAGTSAEMAKAAALGETIERYCCSVYDPDSMFIGSWNDLNRNNMNALHPSECPLFSEKQYERDGFPFKKFREETVLRWVAGWSLTKQKTTWIPATFVYIPYLPKQDEENITDSVSTGLACSTDPWEAVLSGLYECIERDAVMIHWFGKIKPKVIDPSFSESFSALYERHFQDVGGRYILYDISLDIDVPIIFGAVMDDNTDNVFFACGAAANLDVEIAARKALVEAAQGRVWLKFMKKLEGKWDYNDDFTAVKSFEDHVRLFGNKEMKPHLGFFSENNEVSSVSRNVNLCKADTKTKIKNIVRMLNKLDQEVIIVDVTAPEIFQLGFSVVKVFVPGLQQLNADYNHRLLGSPRLYQVPYILGKSAKALSESDLNPIPHPFP